MTSAAYLVLIFLIVGAESKARLSMFVAPNDVNNLEQLSIFGQLKIICSISRRFDPDLQPKRYRTQQMCQKFCPEIITHFS